MFFTKSYVNKIREGKDNNIEAIRKKFFDHARNTGILEKESLKKSRKQQPNQDIGGTQVSGASKLHILLYKAFDRQRKEVQTFSTLEDYLIKSFKYFF